MAYFRRAAAEQVGCRAEKVIGAVFAIGAFGQELKDVGEHREHVSGFGSDGGWAEEEAPVDTGRSRQPHGRSQVAGLGHLATQAVTVLGLGQGLHGLAVL